MSDWRDTVDESAPPPEPEEIDYSRDEVGSPVYTEETDTRPSIPLSPNVSEVVDAAEEALIGFGVNLGTHVVYQRAGLLARVVQAPEKVARIERTAGTAIIGQIEPPTLTEILSKAARFEKFDGRGKKWLHCIPPAWVANTLAARGTWAFPPLRGIITSPTMRESGTILDRPGYDEETGLLLVHSGRWPKVRENPKLENAQNAMVALWETVKDFPFVATHGCAATIAAILTVCARTAIPGPTPLFVITATDAGSGKTLLANVVSTIGTGAVAPSITPWDNPEEGRKTMLALALAGDPVALIDNFPTTRHLGDEALDCALTSGMVRGRILGESRIVTMPWESVLLVTGNNLTYGGDTARRTVPIDLNPRTENPEERQGFAHDPLLAWVGEERKKLVVAALTILRAYHVAGRPRQAISRMGSFEAWSDLVRSAIVWTGYEDPCIGRRGMREKSDPIREQLTAMLRKWFALWPGQWLSVAEIKGRLKDGHSEALVDLDEAVTDLVPRAKDGSMNTRALGKALARYEGQVRGGFVVERGKEEGTQIVKWRVVSQGNL